MTDYLYGTSMRGGRIRFLSSMSAADAPLSAVLVKSALVNNFAHIADSHCAQARVNFMGMAAGVGVGQGYIAPVLAPAVVDQPTYIRSFGPWPVPILSGGQSYKLRIRLAGAASSANAVTFYAFLGPVFPTRLLQNMILANNVDSKFTTTPTSSTSPAWLSGVSGFSASETMIQMSAVEVTRCHQETSTLQPDGTTIVGADHALVRLHIFGSTANLATTPRLYACHATDWVG